MLGRPPRVDPETALGNLPPGSHRPHRRREDGDPEDERQCLASPRAALDPLVCQMAQPSGVSPGAGQGPASEALPAALPLLEDLQNLINGLARRVAWGGDRRKGSARIELSEGPLAGATLIVHTEQRSVSVELELPAGTGLGSDWQERILERLEDRGFAAQVRVG